MKRHTFLTGIFFLFLLSNCGEYSNNRAESSGEGSIVFSVKWVDIQQSAPNAQPPLNTEGAVSAGGEAPKPEVSASQTSFLMSPVDCTTAGISTVTVYIHNSDGSYANIYGGPWSCSLHSGTISNVPTGTKIVDIVGQDSSLNIIYTGQTTVTVSAGQTTNAGEITVSSFYATPSSPANGATVTSSTPTFSWTGSGPSYDLQVSTSSTFSPTTIDTSTSSTSYTPTTALSSGTYYWRVRAYNSYGDISDWSTTRSFTVSTTTTISAPTGVTATAYSGVVTVSWNAVTGASSYKIYYSTSSTVSKTSYSYYVYGLTSTSFDIGLNNGTTYYFIVTASDSSSNESSASSTVSAKPTLSSFAPSAPTAVTATKGNGQVTLSWTSVSGATSYYIYWGTTSSVSRNIFSENLTSTTNSYTHTGLTNGTTYYYVITALNSYGMSGESSQVSATPSTTSTTTLMGGSIQGTSLNLTSTNAAVTTFAGSAGTSGSTNATGTSARFYNPNGITTDGTNLYVADTNNYTIRKIVISTGVVTTIAGSAGSSGSTDGTGTSARFNSSEGITTDGTNLFITDYNNHTIRKIVISTGVVTTIAGTAGSSGSTDATGTSARFNSSEGITTDGTNLFITDYNNHTIRKIQ